MMWGKKRGDLMSREEIPADLPVHESLKPLAYREIYRTERWWCAAVLLQVYGRREVDVYQWLNSGGVWKRKQKFSVKDVQNWNKIRQAVESLIGSL